MTELHTWSRPDVFDHTNVHLDEGEHARYVRRFRTDLIFKFKKVQLKSAASDNGMGLRSGVSPDLLVDEAAYKVTTTKIKRLSRRHWEDVVQSKEGTPLVLYIRDKSDLVPKKVAAAQRKLLRERARGGDDPNADDKQNNLAGQTVVLSGRKYVCLKATIKTARMHHDAINGLISRAQLQTLYERNEGFTLSFDGTSELLTLSWRDVVDLSDELLIFGRPFESSRNYDLLFRRKNSEAYVKQVFQEVSRETWGDHVASYALLCSYLNRLLELAQKRTTKSSAIELLDFYETDKADLFFKVFDNRCRIAFARGVFTSPERCPAVPLGVV